MQRNIFEGSEFLLFDIDDNPIALSNNCSLKIKNNLIDITTKDSANWKENMSSIKDWSIEFDGLVSYNSSTISTSFFTQKFDNSTPFYIQMGVIQAGFTHVFWGEVELERLDLEAGNGEVASYSGSLKGIGSLEFTNSGTPAQSGYLKVESDPIFRGSAAFNITNTNKTDWTEGYNKTLQSIGFSTVGNQTTLKATLRDGSVYSAPFTQIGGGSGNVDLSAYYNKIQSDARFQPIGNYVASQYLSDNYYSKTQIDSKGYLTSVSWDDIMAKPSFFDSQYSSLVGKPTNLSQFTNDLGNYGGFLTTEIDTLDSVLGRGNTSAKNITVSGVASFQNELLIPTTPSNKVGAIWVGSPSGTYTGSTSGGGGTSDYNQLINRPTNLSQFVNDLNNYGNWLTADGASYAGFASNALDYPYMRHASSGQVIRLLRYDQVTSMAFKNEAEVHKFGTFTADANTVAGHTSNFTYGLSAPFVGSLMHFGASATGTYGTQFNTNYGNGTQLAFRTHNGDNGTWNPWYKIWTQADFLPSVTAAGSSVVQRDANGYIFNSYINTTDDIQGGSLGYIVGKLNSGDNYHRSFTAGAVQGWLGLGDLAYLNNSSIDLQFATNRGNTTNTGIGITRDGVGNDPYGAMSVTRGQASDYSYYGLTRSGQIGWGIGIDTSNRLVFGNNSSGYSGVFGSIPHAFDASGNANHSNNINAGGSLNVAGASYLKATHVQAGSVFYQYNIDNSLAAQSDMRSDTIHKYVYRTSDGAPLSWKENWYNSTGAVYHSWSTDSAGFVASSKLTAISAGNGAVTYSGALETRGVNAGITFHYPAYYAAPLWMDSAGTLVWNGPQLQAGTIYGASAVRSAGWLYSNGNAGWYNETYGGGMYMVDSTYIRTYNSKILYVDNNIISSTSVIAQSGQVISESGGFKSTNYRGLVGDYDTGGTSDKIIWTIGDGWNTIAGHYGLGYSYNSPLVSTAHQIVGRHAGGTTFSLNLTTGGATFTGRLIAPEVQATGKMIIPTSAPSSMENGCIWIA